MTELRMPGRDAHAPANPADIAEALMQTSGCASRSTAGAAGRRRSTRPAASRRPATRCSTTAGRAWRNCRPCAPRCRWRSRAASSPATIPPICPSTVRSIPIAAASMAASIASPGPPMPMSGCRRGWISRPRLFAKPDAARLLERELSRPGYKPRTIAIGTNTDPYQPVEKEWRIMRQILEVMHAANHPVAIVTKSALIARDIDILSKMAAKGLAKVALSVTSMDRRLSRLMEPRAPRRRGGWRRSGFLSEAGIPTAAMVARSFPGSTTTRSSASSMPPMRPVPPRRAMCCCGCRWKSARCSATGCCGTIRTATAT